MSEYVSPESLAQTPDPEVIRVLVGLPHEGMTGCEAYCNRLGNFKHLGHLEERGKLLKQVPRFEFLQVTIGRMHVFVAREEMAKKAVAAGVDYLLMIDDDMICPDDLFEKLYVSNKDIVAPLAFTRNFPHKPVIYSCIDGWDPVIQKEHFTNYPVMNYPKDKLFECDAMGFGAVLIKVPVLKAIDEPRFMSTTGTGEDILFCYKAKKKGFHVWGDSRIKLGHVSHPVVVTEDYALSQWKQYGMDVDRRNGAYEKYAGNGDNAKEPLLVLGD